LDYKTIKFERKDKIGILSLNRPERLNAFTVEMLHELGDCFGKLYYDLTTRVVILRGEGRIFCAGTDLNVMVEGGEGQQKLGEVQYIYHKMQQPLSEVVVRMRKAPQPIIAAVHGAAAGGGFGLSLASDVRIAGEAARFNAAFIRVGLSAGDMGVSYFLPRLIGWSKAAEYLFTGRFMDAKTAERFGLVARVVPTDQVLPVAMELANEMLQNSPMGLRMTKEVLNTNIDAGGLESALQLENRTQTICSLTEDNKEAAKAFLEKRPANFEDR